MRELGELMLITAAAGVGGTGLGGVGAGLFRRESDRVVSLLLSFAAGVMIGVVCFDLLSEAVGLGQDGTGRLLPGLLGVACGYGAVFVLNTWLEGGGTPEGRTARRDSRRSLLLAGVVMAGAIALHNMPEGMVIGAAFVRDSQSGALTGRGAVMAAVIGMHNIPEGMAVAAPLIAGGMSRPRAVVISAATGAPTLLGALLGYGIGTLGSAALSLSLGFASGAMLYVVFSELLPEAGGLWRSRLPAAAAVAGMMTGLVMVC